MDIGVCLPIPAQGGPGQAEDFAAAARRAEDLGFESVWASDDPAGRGSAPDAVTALSAAAAATTRIRVGYGVPTVSAEEANHLAERLAHLQSRSGGRVLLRVGAGGSYDAGGEGDVGVAGDAGDAGDAEGGERTDRGLERLRGLLAESYAAGGGVGPALVSRVPWPPCLIGGRSEASLRRAARHHGWFPDLASAADLAGARPRLNALAAASHGTTQPTMSTAVPVALHPTGAGERHAPSAGHLLSHYGDDVERAAALLIRAEPPEAAEVIVAYARAGVDRLVLRFPVADWRTQYELAAQAAQLARSALPLRSTATAGNQTGCGGWARVTLDVERRRGSGAGEGAGTYSFVNPLGADHLEDEFAAALEEGVREGLAGEARTVRVHRAWVHAVDANESVFRRAGREAVTKALAAERAGTER
ncbi:LLM class flavin-dependent oxidoreductase [Streptomyces sp. NPDC005865]|uniref:LLM class flavin-dependent oxidoreductase n=1 Tax=Streptomyces sp. NPDC005865 TaxID=3155453 RepID=UPI0033DB53ED